MEEKRLIQDFLRYVRFDTRSVGRVEGEEKKHPSCPGQVEFINTLLPEIEELGVPRGQIMRLGDSSLLVDFQATEGHKKAPHVTFAAHVDSYFGCPGGATPLIHEYKGGDIVLPNEGTVIPASDLNGLKGKRIITASGDTLLSADNKAGVASLMALIRDIMRGLEHGPLTIWFCTDEEIGEVGVKFLPEGVADQWDIFVTMDGERLGIMDVGCFYGAEVAVEFRGNDSHPGVDGPKLKPAHYAASRFVDQLGDLAVPWTTKNEESFIYVPSMPECLAGKSIITVFPRTFQEKEFPEMEAAIKRVAKEAAGKYDVTVIVSDTKMMYVSTEVAINAKRHLLRPISEAFGEFSIQIEEHRVRAGTDGAMLNMTYPNIPAPNIGLGSRNLHGNREFLVVDEFELVPNITADMVKRYSNMTK